MQLGREAVTLFLIVKTGKWLALHGNLQTWPVSRTWRTPRRAHVLRRPAWLGLSNKGGRAAGVTYATRPARVLCGQAWGARMSCVQLTTTCVL